MMKQRDHDHESGDPADDGAARWMRLAPGSTDASGLWPVAFHYFADNNRIELWGDVPVLMADDGPMVDLHGDRQVPISGTAAASFSSCPLVMVIVGEDESATVYVPHEPDFDGALATTLLDLTDRFLAEFDDPAALAAYANQVYEEHPWLRDPDRAMDFFQRLIRRAGWLENLYFVREGSGSASPFAEAFHAIPPSSFEDLATRTMALAETLDGFVTDMATTVETLESTDRLAEVLHQYLTCYAEMKRFYSAGFAEGGFEAYADESCRRIVRVCDAYLIEASRSVDPELAQWVTALRQTVLDELAGG